MTKLLLSIHVLAALLAIGPVAVAASMFPRSLRRAHGDPGDREALAGLRLLHRVCRVYAAVGVAVPVFGFATARNLGVLGSGWLITSIVLTAVAAAVLGLLILPAQEAALEAAPGAADSAARLAMLTGVFNLLWATVTVLMIVRPGSTTGA
ncbi:hypothetical protein [Streptomyces sp. NBC_00566]|uniref:hypothetical protein n=1 Tax=Streptomyces sp. NBC_00566 TaxID=2975778 RepID=UPI002E801B12|nr:hypothetical protein [Streptomyces sp. NBC_00566]WUB86644.1 hypothetical protein OG812_08595 [Streptomyces sp. NBC_00566]